MCGIAFADEELERRIYITKWIPFVVRYRYMVVMVVIS